MTHKERLCFFLLRISKKHTHGISKESKGAWRLACGNSMTSSIRLVFTSAIIRVQLESEQEEGEGEADAPPITKKGSSEVKYIP